jgi:hypothetical protein
VAWGQTLNYSTERFAAMDMKELIDIAPSLAAVEVLHVRVRREHRASLASD